MAVLAGVVVSEVIHFLDVETEDGDLAALVVITIGGGTKGACMIGMVM